MTPASVGSKGVKNKGHQPPTGGLTRRTGYRLSNLAKLYYVPVFALRDLLEKRTAEHSLGHLRQADLVRKADSTPSVTEADVDSLYENYRYGGSLALYLYLIPDGVVEPDIEEFQATLDEVFTEEQLAPLDEIVAGKDYEHESTPSLVTLLDQEEVDGYWELRFRYYVTHRFLNVDEQPDEVLQSRYGFLWIDGDLGYLAILSRDEQVNRLLTHALAKALRATPQPIRFTKEVLDKHFSIERAKRLSYYDPGTGVRRSISGQNLWQRFELEIRIREQQYARPSSMYDEEVTEGVISGLGVTASKGRLYLTRLLPTSVVRDWARRRLPDLVRDVKELAEDRPEPLSRPIEALKRMRLASSGKGVVQAIIEALLQTERQELTSVHLIPSALEIYQALAGRYFNPYLRIQCGQCDETAELCPYCEGQALEFEGQLVTCEDCGATVSTEDAVVLRCMNGHVNEAPLNDAWSIAPNHWLQKRVARVFAEVGLRWDERNDYFHIEGKTLFRLRRDEAQCQQLPPVVQNYISNFWDPVTGQVHAGSGDIVVEASRPKVELPSQHLSPARIGWEQPPNIKVYKSLNLWLRGNAATGYTVEAAVTGGARIPLQPVLLPKDTETRLQLATFSDSKENPASLKAAGRTLFHAIFPMPVRRLWTDMVTGLREGEGIRICLRIEPRELAALPWEILCEADFVGQQLRFPIVRYLELPNPPEPLVALPPLRILVAAGQAGAPPEASNRDALAHLQTIVEQHPGKVLLDVLEAPGRDELLSRLGQGYHVLHFVGLIASQQGESSLALREPASPENQAPAWLLGKLSSSSALRLVVLEKERAAGTEEPSDGSTRQLAAEEMVKEGMPAVVTVAQPLPGRAANAFSAAFYGALAAGSPVDTAVQMGRHQVLKVQDNGNSLRLDWAIPTLTMRTPNGMVFAKIKEQTGETVFRKETIKPTVTYTPTFHGPIYGPVHAGRGDLNLGRLQYGIQADDLAGLFASLRRLVDAQAPADQKQEALRQVDALQAAIREGKPSVSKMDSVLDWFRKHIPKLAGAVTSVIVNPIVGKLVEAAGEMAAAELRDRFGR